jgi:hypothetical protein
MVVRVIPSPDAPRTHTIFDFKKNDQYCLQIGGRKHFFCKLIIVSVHSSEKITVKSSHRGKEPQPVDMENWTEIAPETHICLALDINANELKLILWASKSISMTKIVSEDEGVEGG